LADREGKFIRDYDIAVENDELVITDANGELFEYKPNNKESQRIQETLFHEKQSIIENCLFGVDINPNSVKICRLRLWIELLKNAYYESDQSVAEINSFEKMPTRSDSPSGGGQGGGLQPEKRFRTLQTLPNIDINIKCGNSLVSRFAIDSDLNQALKQSKWNIESYRMAVSTYRTAQNKEQKREMERLIADIKSDFRSNIDNPFKKRISAARGKVDKIATEINTQQQWGEKPSKQLNKELETATAQLKKLEQEKDEIENNKIFENAFEWRFEFPEVLDNDGKFVGFDVVIGNPPYISAVNMKRDDLLKEWFTKNYPLVSGTYDIYALFIEKIKDIGNKSVCYSYIIPNKFLVAKYSERLLSELIKTKSISKSINFAKHNVFEEASVYPIIINGQFGKSKEFIRYNVESLNDFILKDIIVKERSLKSYPTLKECGFLVQGGLAGFQADSIKKYLSEIQDENKIEFTVSGGVDRYSFNNKNIRYMGNKYSEAYLAVDNGLSSDKKEFYENPKVVIAGMTKVLESVFVKKPLGLGVGIYGIHRLENINDGYFLSALINSKFINDYFAQKFKDKALSGGYLAINKNTIEDIPYIEPDNKIKTHIVLLSKQIHTLKHQDTTADTSTLESEIDRLVYELYGLSEEEIKIVEGA